jgi:hypothetical protein
MNIVPRIVHYLQHLSWVYANKLLISRICHCIKSFRAIYYGIRPDINLHEEVGRF